MTAVLEPAAPEKAGPYESEFLNDVLRDVNAIRKDWGLGPLDRLPNGSVVQPRSQNCPLAVAFDGGVGFDEITSIYGRARLTPTLHLFVRCYDAGAYRNLADLV